MFIMIFWPLYIIELHYACINCYNVTTNCTLRDMFSNKANCKENLVVKPST